MDKNKTYKINDTTTIKIGAICELKAYAAMNMHYSVDVIGTKHGNGTSVYKLTLKQFTELSEIASEYWKEYLF